MKSRIIIVGAGIAGLSLGVELQNYNVTIFEASPAVGGLCGSWQDSEGHWHDYGPHIYRGDFDWFRGYVPECRELPRIDKVKLCDAQTVDYPVQTSCKDDIAPNPEIEVRDYGSYCRRHYGDKLSYAFFFPYNEKFYGKHITNISKFVAGRTPAIGQAEEHYLYPTSGRFDELPRAMAEGLGRRVHCSCRVSGIDMDRKLVLVNDNLVAYDTLVWCADLDCLMRLANHKEASFQPQALNLTTAKHSIQRQETVAIYSAVVRDPYHRLSYECTLKCDTTAQFAQYESSRAAPKPDHIVSSFWMPNAYTLPTVTWVQRQPQVVADFAEQGIVLHGRAATGIHKNIQTIVKESKEMAAKMSS
jgi:UDP-galactopyranose mutase